MDFIKLLRIKHWLKNIFLFAPLIFSMHLFEIEYWETIILGFFVFSFLSSIVYVINDIADRDNDRNHPEKRNRPIASGKISVKTALIIIVFLLIAVIILASYTNKAFIISLTSYLIVNILYSFYLKHIVILDVFSIAFGFMIRILAGAWIINVEISSWLILCTLFLSLFLGITKRRSEVTMSEASNLANTRKVLSQYTVQFADQMSTIAASGAVISYALYTVSERTIGIFHTDRLVFTTPFVIFGIFRYLYLVHKKNLGENPTAIVTSDFYMIINMTLWLLTSVAIIYKYKFAI